MYSGIVTLPIFSSLQSKLSVDIEFKTNLQKIFSQSHGASAPQVGENFMRIVVSAELLHKINR